MKEAFTLTIGKANNTLSISCANITYGTTPAPSVGTNVSGGAVTYAYKVQGADDSTYTATVPTGVGSYTVRGTSAATANYNTATATANFTIGKANNTLSISCADITYGATPAPSVETNISGGAVTYVYKVQGTDDSTYTDTVPTGAGSYTVRGTSAATANYNAATATANFNIIKSAGISPAGGTFDRNPSYQADVTTTITWNSAVSVKDAKADGVTIGAGSYSVVGDTLTVKKEYLATKTMGNLVLSIEFDKGVSATFTIAISDTTPYSVTYNANGGSGTAPTEDNKVAGSTFKAANNTLTPPASKEFKEWNTAANGSGTAYAPDATVTMPAQNFTLYAVWRDFTPAECIEADFDALLWNAIKGSNSAENDVKTALNLPKTGANGTTITWSASPTGMINTGTGAVIRQLDDDKTVALTATVSYTGATAKTKTFNLNVTATPGKFEAEDAVISNVRIFGGAQAVGASGEEQVGDLKIAGKSYVQWNNLPKSHMVEIRYASLNNGTISIYKNGVHIMDAAFTSTGGWFGVGCFRSIWLPLEIDSGDSLKIQYDHGDAVLNLDYIQCYSSIIESASISLDSGTFDRNPAKQADAVASIIWNSAKTITDVKAGGVSIGSESYSVVGNKLTIKKEYLASQPFGDLALTVVFDKGDPTAFTIITIPGNAVISPAGVTFDRNPTDAKWTDVTATITWNDANAVADVKLNGVSVGTDTYAVSGDMLTIKGDRLIYQPVGDLTATIVFDRGDPATLGIDVVPMNAYVFPESRNFKKDAAADVTTYVTFNDAVSVTDITAGGVSIGAANYSVSGYVLTIKKEYLAEQDEGELILTVVFDKGASDTLTITIADNPSVSPTTGTYDRTPGRQADVTAAIQWNGAASVSYVVNMTAGWTIIDPESYEVAGNTLTIKKEFLATLLPVGDFEFSVYFDIGEPVTLTVTILPGNASINPNSGTFDKNPAEQENVTATITENDSKGVKYVKAGDTDLAWGSDIDMEAGSTIGEGTLIIKKEYLASQPVGELVLTVGFWAGDPVTLTINIIDTTPEISAAILGVTAPVCGATPATAIIETAQYSGTVTWNPAHNPFAPSTVYTATITLTPKAGYTLSGITENFFTVDGATATNAANSGVVTATFPATGAEPAVTYSVTYNANGGEGIAPTESDKAASATFAAANNTLTPPTGKKFKHWYTNPLDTGGTPYAQGATVTMPANDLILYAIWEDESPDKKRGYLEVKTLEGGEVKLNGSSTPLLPVYSTSYEMGKSIRLEAAASSGYTFAYWLNVKNASIISDDPVYEVMMGSGINVTAVFTKVPAAEDPWYTVTFKDRSGKILQLTNVAKNGSVPPPAEPPLFGYSFSHWSHSSRNVTSDRIITAIYVRETGAYTVTVAGGTLSTGGNEGSYRFDMPVTVAAGAAPDGQKFSHWEQDGKKVSTKSTFTFFAPMRDTSLVAVFVDNSTVIENKPFITLSNDVMVNSTNGTILFTAIKDLRADYTLVESGVLLLKLPTSDLTVNTPNVILGNILDTSTDQFYIMKSNVEAGDTWYGRAYLIYKDREGNMVTVYSDNIEPGTR
ncbi:X2-like carbohydrate binding domain-containing protein [Desulfotomaculum sp. 1211_IL3151]|uniref:X2-like carbohydrate binding domain-containing protein n=1 Tax=Desulfotomaculum sp. 1211_IL3151 TaxID=3084055 RepID=UPI002FDB6F5A